MKTFESERTYFRPLDVEDVTQTYVDWLNDPEVNRFLESRYTEQTLNGCREYVQRINASPTDNFFGIFLKADDTHIGNAKIGAINMRHRVGQSSMFIGDKSQWGTGVGSEVMYAITKYGFNELGLERIEAGCNELNLASLKMLLKTGYSVDGFLRNHALFEGRRVSCFWMAILKNELPER